MSEEEELLALISKVIGKDFSLGGGQSLKYHKLINRMSQDADYYSSVDDSAEPYDYAESGMLIELPKYGYIVTKYNEVSNDIIRVFDIVNPKTGYTIRVDIGSDSSKQHPTKIIKGVNVHNINDSISGKLRAFYQRGYERDYYDIYKISCNKKYDISRLYRMLKEVLPHEANLKDFTAKLDDAKTIEYEDIDEFYDISHNDFLKMQKQLAKLAKESKKIKDYDYQDFYSRGRKTSGICIVCGRKLTSLVAIARGYGDNCANKL